MTTRSIRLTSADLERIKEVQAILASAPEWRFLADDLASVISQIECENAGKGSFEKVSIVLETADRLARLLELIFGW